MDSRITKKRLGNMFAYDWLKIAALVAAAVAFFSLLYSFTGARLSNGQQFVFVLQTKLYSGTEMVSYNNALKNSGRMSYEVQSFLYETVDTTDYTSLVSFEAKMNTGTGDLIILDNNPTFLEDGSLNSPSYLYAYVDRDIICCMDEIVASAKEFCAQFYIGGNIGEDRIMDNGAVETYFRQRAKKDSRFKRESEILEGIESEKARIEGYLTEALKFEGYMTAHPEYFISYSQNEQLSKIYPEETYIIGEEKIYGLNLAYFGPALLSLVRGPSETNCEGLAIGFMGFKQANGDMFYESITAINFFIERYS